MKTETAAQMAAEKAALGFENRGSKSSAHIRGRSQRGRLWVPFALGSAVLAFFVLPKAVRKTVVVAALPVAVPWLRRFFR